ncbi:MAG: hypothetical protein M1484_02290 [Patescibacteria group bacterium]|nr:hypothetical protein [Patescibacteria group bacterium]
MTTAENKDLVKLAINLNKELGKKTPAYKLLPEIRAFPKPILVDYNETLVGNSEAPLVANPEASSFLDRVRETGTVFVLTSNMHPDRVHTTLERLDLWRKGMIVMTPPNYDFLIALEEAYWGQYQGPAAVLQAAEKITDEFIALHKLPSDRLVFAKPPAYKTIAPIFGKPFDIPLVDDSAAATVNNLGIFGLTAKMFTPNSEELWEGDYDRLSLTQAADRIIDYYRKF